MFYDQDLVDRLSALPTERFAGEVFRATRVHADATAASISGGRWAPPGTDPGVFVLYTSFEQDGAIAEVASFLADLTPIPGPRSIKVSKLGVSASRTLHLGRTSLQALGIDLACYGDRDYALTQSIGAALVFLGLDGLVAPSARWPSDNLIIFSDNHSLNERLEIVSSEEVEWRSWAIEHGLIDDQGKRRSTRYRLAP